MRILDQDRDIAVDNVMLLLKMTEARELRSALDHIINANDLGMHNHVSEDTYQREITVALYSEQDLSLLHQRCRNFILNNE